MSRRARGEGRFAFLVHPLSPAHRRLLGVRWVDPPMALGLDRGLGLTDVGPIAQVGLPGVAMGTVLSIALDPAQMVAEPMDALVRMWRAAQLCPQAGAVGLGSLCAVVAGRGEELAARLPVPVTTGGAATAWALHRNTRAALAAVGRPRGPVAVIGSSGPVGRAVAALLAGEGVAVVVDGKRGGKGLDVRVAEGADDAARGCPVVVGAGPTGGSLSPGALAAGALLVDVALPGTLSGPAPAGCTVLAGEAVLPPPGWSRRGWGRLFHLFAGYGPRQVFACLVEPLVLVAAGRDRPYALGRRLEIDDIADLGARAEALGFQPRLARGWRGWRG
ncbi:hypothetical protein L6R53_20145 [Myxococcota bacterium]|nr:hypothetical protein [Myxococcota bacterium]